VERKGVVPFLVAFIAFYGLCKRGKLLYILPVDIVYFRFWFKLQVALKDEIVKLEEMRDCLAKPYDLYKKFT
jgi:hypothetical protein